MSTTYHTIQFAQPKRNTFTNTVGLYEFYLSPNSMRKCLQGAKVDHQIHSIPACCLLQAEFVVFLNLYLNGPLLLTLMIDNQPPIKL
jgi:hypothetical protein